MSNELQNCTTQNLCDINYSCHTSVTGTPDLYCLYPSIVNTTILPNKAVKQSVIAIMYASRMILLLIGL